MTFKRHCHTLAYCMKILQWRTLFKRSPLGGLRTFPSAIARIWVYFMMALQWRAFFQRSPNSALLQRLPDSAPLRAFALPSLFSDGACKCAPFQTPAPVTRLFLPLRALAS